MAILQTERVLTLDYWKKAKDIVPGDYVFDQKGNPVKVTLVQNFHATQCYEVTLDDHLTVAGNQNLGFLIESEKYRTRARNYKGVHRFRRPLQQFTVSELLEKGLYNKRNRKLWSIPTTHPLNLPHQYLPIPPFVMGFWFYTELALQLLSPPAKYYDDIVQRLQDSGYKVEFGEMTSKKVRGLKTTPNIRKQLLPLVPNKIPNNYLMGSPEQRTELLSGIMMARKSRYNPKTDRFVFISSKKPLAQQVQFLAESLGSITNMIYFENTGMYVVRFRAHVQLTPDQKLPSIKKPQYSRRYIKEIKEIQPQSCVHIETESPDTGFLVGEGFIACR